MPDGSIEIAPALTDEQLLTSVGVLPQEWDLQAACNTDTFLIYSPNNVNELGNSGRGAGTCSSSPGNHVAGTFGMSAAQMNNSACVSYILFENFRDEKHFVSVAVRDMITEALKLPDHLEVLRDKLAAGQIVGMHYWRDDLRAGCFYGTMMMAAGQHPHERNGVTTGGLRFGIDGASPRERLFSLIGYGAEPSNNRFAQAAYEGVCEAIKIRDNIVARAQKPASPPLVSKRLPWYGRALAVLCSSRHQPKWRFSGGFPTW